MSLPRIQTSKNPNNHNLWEREKMKQPESNQTSYSTMGILGRLAILLGILYLIDAMFGGQISGNIWPLYIIVSGAALFVGALYMDEKNGTAFAIVSSITTVSGLISLVHVLTDYWATWAYTWALLYPTAIGIGMLAYGMLKARPEISRPGRDLFKVGLGLFTVLAVFFEFIVGLGGFSLEFGWPLLLISAGLFALALKGVDVKHFSFPFKATGNQPGIDS